MEKQPMNLACLVVLYNPQTIGIEKVKNNILSYANFCQKTYIIDNSEKQDIGLKIAGSLKKSEYIFNGNKAGIAGALNKGCAQALADGFDYILTMDQDSWFEEEQIKQFIKDSAEYAKKDKKSVSFSSKIKTLNESVYWTEWIRRNVLSPLKRKVLGKKYKKEADIKFPTEVFTSGNIIKLSVWKEIDGFYEPYFIDEVDFNFCHRLKRAGYNIVKFSYCHLNHFLGKKTFALLPKHLNSYSTFRLYYIFRNRFIERYLFPEYEEKYNREIKNAFFDNCINTIHPIRNLELFLKAKQDAEVFIEGLSK